MEKLLNLLNEYECYRNGYDVCTGWQERDGRIVWVTDDPRPQVRSEYYILSKEYGFIEWLIKKDKLDVSKLLYSGGIDTHWLTAEILNDLSDVDVVTMILSISGNMTKDLISYLK